MEKHHLRTRREERHDSEKICRECHKTIHGLFTLQELRDSRKGLDSVEGLLQNERFVKAVSFIRKTPPGASIRMRLSNDARGRKRRWNG